MTTLRPTSRETPAEPSRPGRRSGAAAPAQERRGFSAIVPVSRIFAPENRDALLLIGATLFLTGFGLIMVLSASSVEEESTTGDPFGRMVRQAIFAAVAIPLMFIVGRMPSRFWKRWAWPMVLVTGGMQLLVFIPGLGVGNGYNTNWIEIAGLTFQPSEFVKFALIIWIGTVLGARRDELANWRRLVFPVVPVVGIAIGLVLVGNDLGTAAIMLIMVFACAFFAGAKLSHLTIGALTVALVALVIALTNPSRVSRITAWIQGCADNDYSGYCWQPQHGLWALADGGILGVGLGNSTEKWNWLPEADSDFIFAIIGEELGLIGALVVLALYTIIGVVLVRMMRRFRDPFGKVVTGGVLVWIVGQAFVNIAVVLGLLPVLGLPLPLISSGGSSLVAVLLGIGVVLSIARSERQRAERGLAESPATAGVRLAGGRRNAGR